MKIMNRNDLIITINNLFDENTNLKVRNEYLESQLEDKSKTKMVDKKDAPLDNDTIKIIGYGIKKLYDEVIRCSCNISVERNKETQELIITSFDKWFDDRIYTYNIPDNMSKEDIKNILFGVLKEEYEEEKSKAIIEFEKNEANE